jgi:hypothetical protein
VTKASGLPFSPTRVASRRANRLLRHSLASWWQFMRSWLFRLMCSSPPSRTCSGSPAPSCGTLRATFMKWVVCNVWTRSRFMSVMPRDALNSGVRAPRRIFRALTVASRLMPELHFTRQRPISLATLRPCLNWALIPEPLCGQLKNARPPLLLHQNRGWYIPLLRRWWCFVACPLRANRHFLLATSNHMPMCG